MAIHNLKLRFVVNEFSDLEKKKEYYKKIYDIIENSRLYANELVGTLYNVEHLSQLIKKQNPDIESKDVAKTIKDLYKVGSIQNIGYNFLSEKYKNLVPSTIRGALSNQLYSIWNNEKFEIFIGKKSVRNYKKNMSVSFMKDAMSKLKQVEGNFTFNLFGIPMKFILGRDRVQNQLAFDSEAVNNSIILNRILDGTYIIKDSSFKRTTENKLMMGLVLGVPDRKKALDPNIVCGIDLGINVPLCCATNIDNQRIYIGSREDFVNQRQRIQIQKRNLQQNLKYTSGGHGRTKKLKHLERVQNNERNFVQNKNHNYSKEAVNFALQKNAGKIHLENLTGIARDESSAWVLRNWSYFELQNMIKYKAEREGIEVIFIDPKNTSRTCPSCGHISADNRLTQQKFECTECKFSDNADFVGAKNIACSTTVKEKTTKKKIIKKVSEKVAV